MYIEKCANSTVRFFIVKPVSAVIVKLMFLSVESVKLKVFFSFIFVIEGKFSFK